MNLRFVEKGHYICGGDADDRLAMSAYRFWTRYIQGLEATCAVVATHEGLNVGFARFDISPSGGRVFACGTWVHHDHRRSGLAYRMWEMALRRLKPNVVDVYCATPAGLEFVTALRARHPEPKWVVGSSKPDPQLQLEAVV